ncbi:HNH endonuclease [Streptomyces sp. NBC_00525]|uniref:HNH endonuclease n=1 Tax=Streptomyces sp. NBC_00525 TaxID=2903660 RepID=UPI002E807E6E|nr:HNH endonuclease [Streptomyces sp. NBC_00525]WUC97863.1 HNH endonuclease [Streptomyces sp. NBC_00525]
MCILCGHGDSDAVDHVIPVSRGGPSIDINNLAPIHGVKGCRVCLRKCNSEKSNKLMSELERNPTSRDWYKAPGS